MSIKNTDPLFPLAATLNRAQACLANGDVPQALQLMQTAVRAAPNHSAAWTGFGVTLRFVGRLEEASEAFLRALALQPDKADAQVFLGMIRLAQGRQKEGWSLYHARWRDAHWTEKLRYSANHLWQGQITSGLRLLLWAEQGFGDVIQFARYAPWLWHVLRSQGASVAFEVPAPLFSLLRDAWPFMEIVARGEARGHFDAHLPLMDLPLRCGGSIGVGGLPSQPVPLPYLVASQDSTAARYGVVPVAGKSTAKPLRVGIVWQGRPTHPDDRLRSIAPDQLQALFSVPGICWVSLQKVRAHSGQDVPWLPDDLAQCRDFSDTARIVASLDLVISIDSAIAHLAGALNRPVWMLLPQVFDWRWERAGETTHWYPSMRLFRQATAEGWAHVASRVADALALRSGVA